MLQMVKDLTFRGVQKSLQECENTGVNAIEGGALRDADRKRESFGSEVDSLVCGVVAKRGDSNTQECGAGQGCGDLSAKITTQVTR